MDEPCIAFFDSAKASAACSHTLFAPSLLQQLDRSPKKNTNYTINTVHPSYFHDDELTQSSWSGREGSDASFSRR